MDELPTDKIDELIDYVYDLTEKPLYLKVCNKYFLNLLCKY